MAERRSGRPRAGQQPGSADVAEDILAAAAGLAARKGLRGTTTREIAEAAGLRQPSLFHYFPNKHAIFHELLERAIAPVLAFCAAEASAGLAPAPRLWRLVWFDTHHLLGNRYCGSLVALFTDDIDDVHPGFMAKRDALVAEYAGVVADGLAAEVFSSDDADAATRIVFGLGEGTLTWAQETSPEQARHLATCHADFGLRGLLTDPAALGAVRQQALERPLP